MFGQSLKMFIFWSRWKETVARKKCFRMRKISVEQVKKIVYRDCNHFRWEAITALEEHPLLGEEPPKQFLPCRRWIWCEIISPKLKISLHAETKRKELVKWFTRSLFEWDQLFRNWVVTSKQLINPGINSTPRAKFHKIILIISTSWQYSLLQPSNTFKEVSYSQIRSNTNISIAASHFIPRETFPANILPQLHFLYHILLHSFLVLYFACKVFNFHPSIITFCPDDFPVAS